MCPVPLLVLAIVMLRIMVAITIMKGGATQTIPIAISKVTIAVLNPILAPGLVLGLVRVQVTNK